MTERLFKVLGAGGTSIYTDFAWPLPTDDGPGEWVKCKGELIACVNGLHLCREQDLLDWLSNEVYEAEARGERVGADNKIVVREARLTRRYETWSETTARLFAADCAERVLPIFERERPDDDRPRKAIEAARAFARGEIDADALASAAWAAWDANAASAAWDASAASAARAARAARAAERDWQVTRLLQYLDGEIQ